MLYVSEMAQDSVFLLLVLTLEDPENARLAFVSFNAEMGGEMEWFILCYL